VCGHYERAVFWQHLLYNTHSLYSNCLPSICEALLLCCAAAAVSAVMVIAVIRLL
jgi:hypothetical protein